MGRGWVTLEYGGNMRRFSFRATALAAAFCILAASAGAAGAQTSQPTTTVTKALGTTKGSFALVDVLIGSEKANAKLLQVRLLDDRTLGTIDDVKAKPAARSELIPLSISSDALPVLNQIGATLPRFTAAHDGQREVKSAALDLSTLTGNTQLPVLGSVLKGQVIPLGLTANLTDNLAKSSVSDKLLDVSVLSGIVGIKAVDNLTGANAAATVADGSRGTNIGGVVVLDLPSILGAATNGADLSNLNLEVVNNLLKLLKLENQVQLPTGSTDLLGAVNSLTKAITSLTNVTKTDAGTVDDLTKDVQPAASVVNTLNSTVKQLPVNSATKLATPVLLDKTVADTLATLQSTLGNVLGGALKTLSNPNLKLLELTGADLSAATKAVDTLAGSAATADVKLGDIKVLGLNVLNTEQLLGVVNQLNSILGLAKPLLDVQLLEKVTNVANVAGYNTATAEANVLRVTLNPLGLLGGSGNLLGGLTSAGALSSAGVNPASVLPVSSTATPGLNGLLNLPAAVNALSQGLTLKLGTVQSASEFRAASTSAAPVAPAQPSNPVAVDTLPRTGAESNLFAAAAVVLMLLSLGIRRSLRRAEVVSE